MSQVRRLDQIPDGRIVQPTDQIPIWQDGRTRVVRAFDLIGTALAGLVTSDGDASNTTITSLLSRSRSAASRATDSIYIEEFGGGIDKTPDQNTAAFALAVQTRRQIRLRAGDYRTADEILMAPGPVAGGNDVIASISGETHGFSRIVCMNANKPVIRVPPFSQFGCISNLVVTHGVAAGIDGDGIRVNDNANKIRLENVLSVGNRHGFRLGQTAISYCSNLRAEANGASGFYFRNEKNVAAANGSTGVNNMPLQWNFSGTTHSVGNAAHGFHVDVDPGNFGPGDFGQVVLGQWPEICTFGNAGSGVFIQGSQYVPVQDLRLLNPFIGEDGQVEIYLDTYGKNIRILGGIVELNGMFDGIYLTGHNTKPLISGVTFDAIGRSPVNSFAPGTLIVGCSSANSGYRTTQPDGVTPLPNALRAVFQLGAPNSVISGCVTDGGTFGALVDVAAPGSAIIGLVSLNPTIQKVAVQSGTVLRGVVGVPDQGV